MSSQTYSIEKMSKKLATHGLGVVPTVAQEIQSSDSPEALLDLIIEWADDEETLLDSETFEKYKSSSANTRVEEKAEENKLPDSGEKLTPSESSNVDTNYGFVTKNSSNSLLQSGSGLVSHLPPEKNTEDGTIYKMGSDPISGESPQERWPDIFDRVLACSPSEEALSRNTENRDVTITGDITGHSRTTGTVDEFRKLFKDRYEKLEKILKGKMPGSWNIDKLTSRAGGKEVHLIGMVNRQWTSQNDNAMLKLEDTTGEKPVVFTDDNMSDVINRVNTDEVVGVVGQLSDDGNIVFGNELFFPDVPSMRSPSSAGRSVEAVLLSDLHFGAVEFAYDEWAAFVEWMCHSEDAENIEYVLIAGDLVEGIGVYPGQEDELGVTDIYDQYVLCAEGLAQLPDDVDIITIMGNHDTVRLAEPQPVLEKTFTKPFADNVTFAGNPSLIDIEGVTFQLYHGMSLNALNDRVPGLDIHEPTGAMKLMLEKRHLAPMYGQTVRIAPEPEDYLVIDPIPDVLHTGHVHTFGMEKYRGVTMANTGCWQYQTDYQRKLNVNPDVGYASIINLGNMSHRIKQF